MSLFSIASLTISLLSSAQSYRDVEVCFVLDTTGSMSSLIDTAKEKIWFIANQIVQSPSRPRVRFCLLGYRDRGDEYVTRHFDLSEDLDDIHQQLLAFKADGGGDAPEAVNQALLEALENTSWSASPDILKLIFLVGDAPPHTDYSEPQYTELSRRAGERGIIINPVLVGSNQQARQAWDQIAGYANGRSTQVDQNAATQTVETAMDQDLAVLGPRLARLAIPYGPTEQQQHYIEAIEHSEAMSDATASDRVSYMLTSGELVGRIDLIEAIDRGQTDIDSLNPGWLPASVRSMTAEELNQHLATVRTERAEIKRIIGSLVEERRSYLEARRHSNGFESVVADLIVDQLGGDS